MVKAGKKPRNYLLFYADPADIIEARRVVRVSDEDAPEVSFLELVGSEDIINAEFVGSAAQIINLYRE